MKSSSKLTKMGRALLALTLLLPVLALAVSVAGAAKPAKNIIFMVPDGMGLSNVTMTRTYLYGPGGDALNLESLPYIGYQSTFAKNSFVTDSAAAASTWASGMKFNNNEVSCLDDDKDGACDSSQQNTKTILELAKDAGLATGLVATSDITHATPAAFGAHVHSRNCESSIFEDYLEIGIDVLLGGGIAKNRSSCLLPATDTAYNENLIAQAQADGYTYVTTAAGLATAQSGSGKLLGLFKLGGLTPQYQKASNSTEPTLVEMTKAALDKLEDDPDGFFVMIEGSQIDWGNHARDEKYTIGEVVDFDNSVKAVREWIAADSTREANTMLVVVADHECGGVLLEGPYGSQATAGDSTNPQLNLAGEAVLTEDGSPIYKTTMEISFGSNAANLTESADHTGVDTIIWSNKAGFGSALDNTDLFYVMKDFLNQTQGSSYVIPYVAASSPTWTGLAISSVDNDKQNSLTLTYYDNTGAQLGSENASIPAGGQYYGTVRTAVESGWIKVDSDLPVNGLALIGGAEGAPMYDMDMMAAASLSKSYRVAHVAATNAEHWDSLFMAANPNSVAATVTLSYYPTAGEKLYEQSFSIPAMGSVQQSLRSLFGADIAGGSLVVSSTQTIGAFLLYDGTGKDGRVWKAGLTAVASE